MSKNDFQLTKGKVKCTHAETDFFIKDKVYPLYFCKARNKKDRYILAEDGLFDLYGDTISKFKEIE